MKNGGRKAIALALALAAVSLLAATSPTQEFKECYRAKDYPQALKLLDQIDKNDPEVQFFLGVIYDLGLGTAADSAKAHEYYSLAAAKNFSRAQTRLGIWYLDHDKAEGVEKAVPFFRKAVIQGDEAALAQLKKLADRGVYSRTEYGKDQIDLENFRKIQQAREELEAKRSEAQESIRKAEIMKQEAEAAKKAAEDAATKARQEAEAAQKAAGDAAAKARQEAEAAKKAAEETVVKAQKEAEAVREAAEAEAKKSRLSGAAAENVAEQEKKKRAQSEQELATLRDRLSEQQKINQQTAEQTAAVLAATKKDAIRAIVEAARAKAEANQAKTELSDAMKSKAAIEKAIADLENARVRTERSVTDSMPTKDRSEIEKLKGALANSIVELQKVRSELEKTITELERLRTEQNRKSRYHFTPPTGFFRGISTVAFSPLNLLRGMTYGGTESELPGMVVYPALSAFTMGGDLFMGSADMLSFGFFGNSIYGDEITPYVWERAWVSKKNQDDGCNWFNFKPRE